MLALVMTSMMVAASDPLPQPAASLEGQPTRYCREMGSASSRSEAIQVCRTRAEWQKWEACTGATRYCSPSERSASLGRKAAFALNEDSRIICRKASVTGTRLQSEGLCLPKREWERMWKDAGRETMRLQDQSTRAEGPK